MLILENLSVRYGNRLVLSKVNHTFEDGRISAILGPSGIGKTTLLHAVAALTPPTEGRIHSSYLRPAYLFQEPRLFPWMTALENVTAVRSDRERAEALLRRLFPDDSVLELYPHELSGGMKQRIALARALAYEPDLLLMDEPFRGLDPKTRERVTALLLEELHGKTVLMVTHDREDLSFCHTVLRTVGSPVVALEAEKSGTLSAE